MKQGTTVQNLLQQVQQNADYKRDFKCPTSALTQILHHSQQGLAKSSKT